MYKWTMAAQKIFIETYLALQTVYDALNQGQQQKLLREDAVRKLFDHYGVNYD